MSELDYVLVDSIGDRVMPTRHTRDDALDRVAKWDAFRPDQTGRYSVHKLVPVEREGQ